MAERCTPTHCHVVAEHVWSVYVCVCVCVCVCVMGVKMSLGGARGKLTKGLRGQLESLDISLCL